MSTAHRGVSWALSPTGYTSFHQEPPLKITAVVPAAGKSERFGSQKLLADVGGRPLITRTIDSLIEGGIDDVVVVTAERSAPVADSRVRRVTNADPSRGMFSSIQAGVATACDADVVLVLPADMPFVRSTTVEMIAHACGTGMETIVPTFGGKRGHPVAMPAAVARAIAAAEDSLTLKQVLAMFSIAELVVDDPGILRDVDRPGDLA